MSTRSFSAAAPPVDHDRADYWDRQALCRFGGNYDPDLWTIAGNSPTEENRYAARLCRRLCPVRWRCAEEAERLGWSGVVAGGFVLLQQSAVAMCARQHCGRRFMRPLRPRSGHPQRMCSRRCSDLARVEQQEAA